MPRINLLPWRESLRKQRQKDFITHAALALIAALSLAALAHVTIQGQIDYQSLRNSYLEKTIANLDKKIEEIKILKKKREDLVARMGAIEKLQATRSLIVILFDELARTTPEGIVLTNVTMGEGAASMQINGFSDTTARVAEYLRALNKSGRLTNAEIIGQGILASSDTSPQTKTKSTFDGKFAFSINVKIVPPASEIDAVAGKESNPK
jgi:type IV pilus assembly protein PilN